MKDKTAKDYEKGNAVAQLRSPSRRHVGFILNQVNLNKQVDDT